MATIISYYYSLFILISLFVALAQSKSTYIVYVSTPPSFTTSSTPHHHHHYYISILQSLSSTSPSDGPHLIYSYSHSATAFAAHLTVAHAAELRQHPDVLSVIRDRTHQLDTTRTPQFMGLGHESGLWPNAGYASDMIIGVVDTGIWPNNPSFNDAGYGPVPATWKGSCEVGPSFPANFCNKKVIGARAFYKGTEAKHGPIDETKESKSPLDTEGHGTHCASTAAGSVVPNASLFNYAKGEARGVAYKSRVAVYKVCWSTGCEESDILAAMDQAIADGVHVLSLSVGTPDARAYHKDSIAIGSFHAMRRGVIVSCSAGNSGSRDFTVSNVAPWILTVGASTIDREFPAYVELGDGRSFKGASLYYGEEFSKSVSRELVDGKEAGSKPCKEGELIPSKVAGKIVICERGVTGRAAKGYAVKQAGGKGMILVNTPEFGEELIADAHLLPAATVSNAAGNQIRNYTSSVSNPTATISFQGTVIGNSPSSPMVAAFSSRGPNRVTPEILKPDVVAPGVNILAAWTGFTSPTDLAIDPRRVQHNIISGTSMSCPHVSGLALLLKNAQPTWSPSAIKSALMTTAYNLDNAGNNLTDLATSKQSTPFAHGSGHVNPNKALDPGLIYDNDVNDYIAFLCASGYSQKHMAVFLKDPAGREQTSCNPGDLNYPSFSVVFEPGKNVVKHTRKVTNVGHSLLAVYRATVNAPPNVTVSVTPRNLFFTAILGRTRSYEISFTSNIGDAQWIGNSSSFGSIEWTDGSHRVRSPIAVRWVQGTRNNFITSI